MAREAAYTGQVVTWDDVLNANQDLVPKNLGFGPMPVPPVPQPGITQLARTTFSHTLDGSQTLR
jgi:myo-inositol 2-dehydrogenase / D-chiro-inositol 1-dehydrogenase